MAKTPQRRRMWIVIAFALGFMVLSGRNFLSMWLGHEDTGPATHSATD